MLNLKLESCFYTRFYSVIIRNINSYNQFHQPKCCNGQIFKLVNMTFFYITDYYLFLAHPYYDFLLSQI